MKRKKTKNIRKQVKRKVKKKIILTKKIKAKKPKKFFTAKKAEHIIKKIVQKSAGSKKKNGKIKKENNNISAFPAQSLFKAKIKVIGIGGGGGSIVSEMGRSLHKATFVIADTDVRAFKNKRHISYFLFGQGLTHGLGTGLNTSLAKAAAEQEKERIAKFFKNQDIIIFVASLGGGLGSGATEMFAKAASEFGGITFGIFTLPFKFEGKHKQKIALRALKELRSCLNVSITIPNERIFKVINADTPITDAFSMVNKNLIESLENLIDLIYSPGIINIDFADLRAILKGMGNLAFLNTVQASGPGRAEKIANEILHNPLYQYLPGQADNRFKAEKVLFNVESSGSASMIEVDKISRVIAQHNPQAKIIFGISKGSMPKNRLKTTLLMTGALSGSKAVKTQKKIQEVKAGVRKKAVILKKVAKKPRKIVPAKNKKMVKKNQSSSERNPFPEPSGQELTPVADPFLPVFNQTSQVGVKKLSIIEPNQNLKKAIRRSALEVKKAQEEEENKKSQQEKEWEIPAFLRLKK